MDPRFDVRYFERLDEIVTVSEECAQILKQRFPKQSAKVKTIYNIVSPKVIHAMVNKEQMAMYERQKDETVILSIGRLHHQKGFELAIEACARLTALGYRVRWYIIGEGEERERLTALIRQHGLEERFILLGLKANPYPYLQQADVYAQPSRFEGKSIAIDEAKILHKPIVVTDFSTAKDQITDGVDGLIVAMDPESIAAGIARLIDDRDATGRLTEHLSRQRLGTEDEIYKLYKLFA
jgi:glycosyltransferase involved in cell wall biosynthesis